MPLLEVTKMNKEIPIVGERKYKHWGQVISKMSDTAMTGKPVTHTDDLQNGDVVLFYGKFTSPMPMGKAIPSYALMRFYEGQWESLDKVQGYDDVLSILKVLEKSFILNLERNRLFDSYGINIIATGGYKSFQFIHNCKTYNFKTLKRAILQAVELVEPSGIVSEMTTTHGVMIETANKAFVAELIEDSGLTVKTFCVFGSSTAYSYLGFVVLSSESEKDTFDKLREDYKL